MSRLDGVDVGEGGGGVSRLDGVDLGEGGGCLAWKELI